MRVDVRLGSVADASAQLIVGITIDDRGEPLVQVLAMPKGRGSSVLIRLPPEEMGALVVLLLEAIAKARGQPRAPRRRASPA